jgi:hypothetical protein
MTDKTMAATTSAPFWLEIKTEYIDANLEKVIAYLSKESTVPGTDPFYEETEKLLGKRIQELLVSLSDAAIGREDVENDKESGLRALRLLGAWLLIQDDLKKAYAREVFFFFVKTLIPLVPNTYTEDLTEVAVRCVTRKEIVGLGFGWTDLKDAQLEILAHKLIHVASFADSSCPESWYQGKGSVCVSDGHVKILGTNKKDSQFAKTVPSMALLDSAVAVHTHSSDRIQQKDEDDVEVMNHFTVGFVRDVARVTPSADQKLKRYSEGDIAPVRYTGKDFLGNLLVETVEGDYEKISGQIPFKSSVYRNIYSAAKVAEYLQVGDIFDAEFKGGARNVFDLTKPFLQALLDYTIEVNKDIPAILQSINKKGLMTWWTADGYPAYVEAKDCDGTYEIGQRAILYITGKESNGYVYATVVEPTEEVFDEIDSERFCVEGILYKDFKPTPVPEGTTLGRPLVRGLARLLFRYQRTLGQVAERFRVLCVCRILSAMTEDADAAEYIGVSCDYLRDLVHFSAGRIDKIKSLEPNEVLAGEPAIAQRMEVIRILQAYGKDSDSDYLSDIIHHNEDALLVKLAKFVQSCNRIDDVYPAIKTVIKREITKFLAVETEDNTDFEDASGPNLGVENSRTEFKKSFFFAPENAREQNQEKNIFRSLCSFLNTQEGGILYLGVNDSGGIEGLESELATLKKRTTGRYKDEMDSYVRYITDRAREYFDLDVRLHFHVEPAYDNRVVAIRVDPYEHGVVELEGVPYIRNNSESVKMSQTVRRQIEAKRIAAGQDKPSNNVVALTEAIKAERQVILHNYSSSNSGEVKEYTVEPFDFVGKHTYLWAYDVNESITKVFRVSRIGNVEITRDPWNYKDAHKKGVMDVFHFSSETPERMVLELDLLAKNLLVEEYPESAAEIRNIGNDRFLLETNICNILGIGRFYCGLAGHIKIIDAPGLVEYARGYFENSLKALE